MKKITILFLCLMSALCASSAEEDTITYAKNLEEVVILDPNLSYHVSCFADGLINKEIQQRNTGQNLPYLVSNTPSMVVTSDDGLGVGYTYFRLRGTDHTRINVTINGVPLNDAESQTVFWVNLPDIASSSQTVSVVRGVRSSYNGTSSFGGNILLNTIPGNNGCYRPSFNGEVSFNGGMYNTFRTSAQLQFHTKRFYLQAGFSKVNSGGYIERATSDLLSYNVQSGINLTDKTLMTIISFGGYEHTYMGWYGVTEEQMAENRRFNPAGLYLLPSGDTTYYPNQADNYTQHHLQIHLRHRFNNFWQLYATAHYTYGEGYYEMAEYATCLPDGRLDGVLRKGLQNHFYGGILKAVYAHRLGELEFGLALNEFRGTHLGTGIDAWNNRSSVYTGYGRKLDGNIYARASFDVYSSNHDHFLIYADMQYRMVRYRLFGESEETFLPMDYLNYYHFFNPKAGLIYSHGSHHLNANFGIANREPAKTNFTSLYPGDEQPASERLYDFELSYDFNNKIGLNLYMMDYDNQLVLTGDMNSVGAYLTRNVKDSYRMGFELVWGYDWTGWFLHTGSLTGSLNRYKTDDNQWKALSFSPAWVFNNTFDFHYCGFKGIISTQVISAQYLDNSENELARLAPYTVTNLNLSYTFYQYMFKKLKFEAIRLMVQLNNVFDTKYVSNGGTYEGVNWYYPQAGINVHAGVCLQW